MSDETNPNQFTEAFDSPLLVNPSREVKLFFVAQTLATTMLSSDLPDDMSRMAADAIEFLDLELRKAQAQRFRDEARRRERVEREVDEFVAKARYPAAFPGPRWEEND